MKLINILSKLDAKALQKAEEFANSPYFNNSHELTSALSFIIDCINRKKEPSKKEIWISAYDKRPYKDGLFRKLIHQLLSLIEDFFIVENTMRHEHKRLRALSEYCEEYDIPDLRNKIGKTILEKIDTDNMVWPESFYDIFTAYRYTVLSETDFETKKSHPKQDELINGLNTLQNLLNTSFSIENIRLGLYRQSHVTVYGESFVNPNQPEIDVLLKEDILRKSRLLNINFKVYNLVHKEDKYDINHILEYLLLLSIDNKNEALTIYLYLSNFIATKTNLGIDLYQERFKLMTFGLDSGLLIDVNGMDPSDYRNIVFTACRLQQYDWALNFVENYKKYLSVEYRQSAYSFSKARIFFFSHNYQKVIETLRNVEYEDITYNLNSRLMLVMAFYELDEYETLDFSVKSFKIFLRRQRNMAVKRKANFRDFCDVVFNLVRAEDDRSLKRLTKARDILSQNAEIPSAWWLKEKEEVVAGLLGVKNEVKETDSPLRSS